MAPGTGGLAPLRVLLLTHHYAPEIGAPQHRWGALVDRFVAAGHQVAVLAPSPHYPSGRAGDLHPSLRPGAVALGRHGEVVHRLRFREYGGALASRGHDQVVTAADAVRVGLARFGGRHRPDVIVATAPGLPTIPAGLALGKALRVPVVLEMRDAWPDLLTARDEWDGAATAPGRGRLHRLVVNTFGGRLPDLITAMQRRADAVVTTTETFAQVLRSRGLQRVTAIRNGTHLPAPLELSLPGSSGEELRVLYLGTVGRSQGLGTAVTAAALARRFGVPVRLRIVGDGAEVPALAQQITQLDAPVELVPPVPRSAVVSQYTWADTVLVALRDWIPFRWTVPSKLYEVLSTGRHISGLLAGEAAGIVETARGGHVVAPGDSSALAGLWSRLHADRSLLDIGPSGREWASRHADDDALAVDYLDLLQRVVAHA
jgi:colanic acid biosynthesis glycosyl transferase WcaI